MHTRGDQRAEMPSGSSNATTRTTSPSSNSKGVSAVFPFRLNRRKTVDDRINAVTSSARSSFKLHSSSSSSSSSRDVDSTHAKNRIRDIFAVPTHKPTGAAQTSAMGVESSASRVLEDGEEDEDDLTAPRVGRPLPTPSSAPVIQPFSHVMAMPPPTTNSSYHASSASAYQQQSTSSDPTASLPPSSLALPPLSSQPTLSQPPAYTPPAPKGKQQQQQRRLHPSMVPQAAEQPAQGRFPRWRGWLEKRALERQMERTTLDHQDAMKRKKSWGAGIADPDAISDDEDGDGNDVDSAPVAEEQPVTVPPPIHLHQFGSRFLPHLPTQPLCAVYLDVPRPVEPPANLNIRKRSCNTLSRRQILLVGASDGLYAVEHRRNTRNEARPTTHATETTPPNDAGWNQDIRCTQVWKGLGVYQLSVLQPSERDEELTASSVSSFPFLASRSNSGSAPGDMSHSGIVLGLCTDSSKKAHNRHHTLHRLSSHTHTALESALGSTAAPTGSSHPAGTASNRSSQVFDEPALSTSFGSGAGGGVGRAVPPGGAGIVKMWNLEAVRRVVAYVVNEQAQPLDLSPSAQSKASSALTGALKLPAMLRGAWASLAEPRTASSSSEKKWNRRAESEGYGVASPYNPPSPSTAAYGGRASQPRSRAPLASSRRSSRDVAEDSAVADGGRLSTDSGASWQRNMSPISDEEVAASERHAQALRLAQACVAINASTGTVNHQGRDSSEIPSPLQSLFGDERVGSPIRPVPSRDSHATTMGGPSGTHGHSGSGGGGGGGGGSAGSAYPGHGKGCLFFAVYESPAGFKAAGTWYLALASTRGILVYEAASSRKTHGSRTWSFLKELYTPLPPKGMAFVPASTAVRDPSLASARPTHGRMNSSSKFSLTDDQARGASMLGGERQSRHTRSGTAPSPSVLMPQHGLGSAGPAAWNGADLSLFVSFGRRAVMIRLSDAHVREIDLASGPQPPIPDSQRPASSETTPPNTFESIKSQHRKRPSSESGRVLLAATAAANSAGHAGAASLSDRSSVKSVKASQYWTGLQHVEAKLTVRQNAADVAKTRAEQVDTSSWPIGGVPMLPSASDTAAERGPPRTLLVDDDDDSDDDSEEDAAGGRMYPAQPGGQLPGITLYDRSLRIHHRGSASDSNIISNAGDAVAAVAAAAPSSSGDVRSSTALRSAQLDEQLQQRGNPRQGRPKIRPGQSRSSEWSRTRSNTFQLTANVALMSRGPTTHVMPYPLPADMVSPLTLDVLRWSDVPSAVTGWSRILGVEQTMSAGPVTTSALSSSRLSPSSPSPTIRLKVSLTVLAFLQYRVEMQRVTIDVDVARPLGMEANVELHLCSSNESDAPAGGANNIPILDPSLRPSLAQERNSAALDLEYPTGFVIPAPHVGGCVPRVLLSDQPQHPHGLTPYDATGDGGAWTFSYRGGEDHRIGYFGAEV